MSACWGEPMIVEGVASALQNGYSFSTSLYYSISQVYQHVSLTTQVR